MEPPRSDFFPITKRGGVGEEEAGSLCQTNLTFHYLVYDFCGEREKDEGLNQDTSGGVKCVKNIFHCPYAHHVSSAQTNNKHPQMINPND